MSVPEVISSRHARSGRRALLIWGAVLVLSGSGIGAGGALLFHKPPPRIEPKPISDAEPGPPDFSPGPIVSRMVRDLNLTPEQTQQVTAAWAQRLVAIKALRADMVVKLAAEHEKLRDAMKKTLTDVQFAQWDQRFEAMRSRVMPDGPPPRDFHHHGGPGEERDGLDGRGGGPGKMHGHGPGGPEGIEGRPLEGPDDRRPPLGSRGDFRRNDGPFTGPPAGQDASGPSQGNPQPASTAPGLQPPAQPK